MATRKSIDDCIQKCDEAIEYAQEQYTEGLRQEHYHDHDYTNALQELEAAYNEVCQLANSANSQQREILHRKRLMLQQLQNQMILLNHDRPI
ncbi:YtzC family protein [Bacillus sp. FJAT-49736]|uniref:YtzC family protein n=1 Tax=Bacillus sp. FJAT-49736 TaxID=2833582 RepID=UPI001BC9BE57|nr:YtzC family protein [Bacillus sp. FJAT-49736]